MSGSLNMGLDPKNMTKLPPEGQKWYQLSQTCNLMSENDFHRKDEEDEPKSKRAKMTINHDHSYSIIPGNHYSQREYQDGQQFILKNSEKHFDTGIFDSEKPRIDTEKSNLEFKNDEGQKTEIHAGQLFDSEQIPTLTERSSRRRPPKGYYFLGDDSPNKNFKRGAKKEQKNENYSRDIFDSESEKKNCSEAHLRESSAELLKKKARGTPKEKSKVIASPKKTRGWQKKNKSINYSMDVFGSMELTEKDMSQSQNTKILVKKDEMNSPSNAFHSMKPSKQIEINKNFEIGKKRKKSDKIINFSRDVFDSTLSEETQKLDGSSIEFERSTTKVQPKTDGEEISSCVFDKETTNERDVVESQKIETKSCRDIHYKELLGKKSFTKQPSKRYPNFMTEKNQVDKNSPLSDVVVSTDSENIKRSPQKLDGASIKFERSTTKDQPKTDCEMNLLTDCTKLSEKDSMGLSPITKSFKYDKKQLKCDSLKFSRIQPEKETLSKFESECTKESYSCIFDKETTDQINERGVVESHKIKTRSSRDYKELLGKKSFTKQPSKRSSNFMTEKNQVDKNSPSSDVVGSTQDSENIKRSTVSNKKIECEKPSESFYCTLSIIKEKSSTKLKKRLSKNCDYLKESESQEVFKPFKFPTLSTSNVKEIDKPDETILSCSAQDIFKPMKSEPTTMNIQHKLYGTQDALEYSKVPSIQQEEKITFVKSPQFKDPGGNIGIRVSKDQSVSDIMSEKSKPENGIFQPEGSKNEQSIQEFLTSFQDGNDASSLDCILEPLNSRESKCFGFKEFRPETISEKKILRYSNKGGRYIDPVTQESEVPDDVMTFSLGSYSIQSQYEEQFKIPAKQPNEFDFLKVEMFDNYEKFNSRNILAKDEKDVSTDDLINEMKNILEEAKFVTEDLNLEGRKQIEIEKLKTVPEGLIKNIKMLRIISKEELIDRKTTAKYTFTFKDFLW